LRFVRTNFVLDWNGVHGAGHWARVLRNGRLVGAEAGADLEVVRLFALLHDSCREDEWADPDHGIRAAKLAVKLRNQFFKVSNNQFEQLTNALVGHSNGEMSSDATIQTCWDADRLDLGRVGVVPNCRYLSPHAQKFIKQAYSWSIGFSLREAAHVAA